ncbi:MAG: hypothetical protein IPL61_29400 [Myxococcales bacterium]|nr:hypothetical protein [Myxococcales bacterium]
MRAGRGAVACVGLVLALVLCGCGPSAAQIRTAHDARYQATPAELVDVAVATLRAEGYKIAVADPALGRVESLAQWHHPEGTMARNVRGRAEDGLIKFQLQIRVDDVTGPGAGVVIEAVAVRARGELQPQPITATDRSRPGWFAGRIDAVYLGIHRRLRARVVPPR